MADEQRGEPLPEQEGAHTRQSTDDDGSQADAASARPARGGPYWFLVLVTAVNLVLDIGTKAWAKAHFEAVKPGHPHEVVVI